MDRTSDFGQELKSIFSNNDNKNGVYKPRFSPSPFVLRAAEMLAQLIAMEKILKRVFVDFVDYHKYLSYRKSQFNDIDRAELDKEISLFLATFISETHELKRNITYFNSQESACYQHHTEIVNYLLERLSKFNKRFQIMKRERINCSRKSFRLLTLSDTITEVSALPLAVLASPALNIQSKTPLPVPKPATPNTNTSLQEKHAITDKFAERYESEVAPPSKLKEYENIAAKHRETLLKESKQLHDKFSTNKQLVNKMEQTISSISGMLDEFVRIVQSQSDSIVDIHDSSKLATKHVEQTGDELLQTIERSQSYRRNMVIVIFLLAILLLLLDFITP